MRSVLEYPSVSFLLSWLFLIPFVSDLLFVRSSEPSPSSLSSLEESTQKLSIETEPIYAVVDYEDSYVEPKILAALQKAIPNIKVVRSAADLPSTDVKLVDWSSYEKIPFEQLMEKPDSMLSCSYIIRFVIPVH